MVNDVLDRHQKTLKGINLRAFEMPNESFAGEFSRLDGGSIDLNTLKLTATNIDAVVLHEAAHYHFQKMSKEKRDEYFTKILSAPMISEYAKGYQRKAYEAQAFAKIARDDFKSGDISKVAMEDAQITADMAWESFASEYHSEVRSLLAGYDPPTMNNLTVDEKVRIESDYKDVFVND